MKKIYTSLELRAQSSLILTDSDSSNSVSLRAPSVVGADLTLTLPDTVVADGLISSDISGNLSVGLLTDSNVDAAAAISLSKLATLTADRALISSATGEIEASGVTATELAFVSGVTSNIQSQIDVLSGATGGATTALDNLTVSGLAAESILVGASGAAVSSLAVGTNGQVLKVVAGSVAWATDSGVNSFTADWITADGLTKSITHGLGSKDVIVQLYNKADDATIVVDSVVRTDTNTIDLTASQAPDASGWRVLIISI